MSVNNVSLQLKFYSRTWCQISFTHTRLLSVVVGLNLVNGIRAGVSMWPNVPVGHIPCLFHPTVDHLDSQRGRTEDVCFAVGLCESTERRRVRDLIIVEVLHELPAPSAGCFQLIMQVRNQIFNISHYCGTQTEQAEQKHQTSTDARDKVQGYFFW